MNVLNIAADTHQLLMNLEGVLFEGVWDIPRGVSLNSYLIKGEKIALIDGFCGSESGNADLKKTLKNLGVKSSEIDYLVINHMEPDHSGWLESFRKENPGLTILCSEKAKDLLEVFYGETENIQVVKDGTKLDLGKGHILNFIEMPNVHWPDTISTFDEGTKILFSCDLFGAFGKIENKFYEKELNKEECLIFDDEMTRYFSNVMATFSIAVVKAVEKCKEYPVDLVAPGHGLMWNDPEKVFEIYKKLADYQKGDGKREITVVYGSMYGMTEMAISTVKEALDQTGIPYRIHRVPEDSWGTVLTSVWKSKGIILGMPTYEYKMFPPMAAVLEEMGKKKVQGKKAFRFGSFGWSGGAQKELNEIMEKNNMKWEFIDSVEFKGRPEKEDLDKITQQVAELVKAIS